MTLFSMAQGQWSNYQKVLRGPYGERGAQAYNGGLGQSLN